jgi:hypothetical protein
VTRLALQGLWLRILLITRLFSHRVAQQATGPAPLQTRLESYVRTLRN